MTAKILKDVESYYTQKVKDFGPSPKGVDWNTIESQFLRFEILSLLFKKESNFTLLDYGCGFGSLCNYLLENKIECEYHGFDVSKEMVAHAIALNYQYNSNFSQNISMPFYDYLVASGIFNVKLNSTEEMWEDYIKNSLIQFNALSTKGFAFNMLTSYSDEDKKRSDLYYANPLELFDFCKKNFSKYVSLHHDYKLYEFTIIVRKN